MSTEIIILEDARDTQSAASIRRLRGAGLDFEDRRGDRHGVTVIGADGSSRSWSGYRPDLLDELLAAGSAQR